MRILGLIALYAVTLVLMSWLLFQSTASKNQLEQSSSFSFVDQTWSVSFPSKSREDLPSNDSIDYFSPWGLLPVGLVRYPDFDVIEFFAKTK
jgi:hypothetical protein